MTPIKMGFLVCILIFSCASACAPVSTPIPRKIAAPTVVVRQTPLIQHTVYPAFSKTPGATPTFVGMAVEQPGSSLQIAAQKYLAASPAEAEQVARALDYLGKDGHPSNVCGPLSIAILRDAGYLPDDVNLHDFWLFKPGEAYAKRLLERYFPAERYEHILIEMPINKIEWAFQPLLPGDFVFIHAGRKGDFSHMLVVTRADVYGRPYSVTNYQTEAGFVIQEQILYDQFDPQNGLFYQWIRADSPFGRTGLGGIEIWRLRIPR